MAQWLSKCEHLPFVLRTYLTLGVVTRTWAVETGDSAGGHGLTSLGCHEHRESLSQSGTHTHARINRAHTRTHGGKESFYPQITMQVNFLVINTECWGNGSVDKALAAQI